MVPDRVERSENQFDASYAPPVIDDQAGDPHLVDIVYRGHKSEADRWLQTYTLSQAELSMRHPVCGSTALVLAVRKGLTDASAALIKAGAPVSSTNNVGDTALHWACFRAAEHPSMCGTVEQLLLAGADPNAEGDMQNTPLHLAAAANSEMAMKLLLMYGAVTNIQNRYNHTAFELATAPGCKSLLQQFREEGDLYRHYLKDSLEREREDTAHAAAIAKELEEKKNMEAQQVLRDVLARRLAEDEADDAAQAEVLQKQRAEDEMKADEEAQRQRADEEFRKYLEDETKRNRKAKAAKKG